MATNIEKVSIALTADMLAMVRQAVKTGDYASTSEVVREALRQWKAHRAQNGVVLLPNAARKSKKASATGVAMPGQALMQTHQEAIGALCKRFQVRRLAQFGSVLRADFDLARSDIDLTVEFAAPTAQSAARQYFDFKAALEQLLKRDVDLVELNAMPDSRLRRHIECSQIPLYAEAA